MNYAVFYNIFKYPRNIDSDFYTNFLKYAKKLNQTSLFVGRELGHKSAAHQLHMKTTVRSMKDFLWYIFENALSYCLSCRY